MNGRCKQCQEGKWRILLLTSLVEKRPRYESQSIALPQSRVRVSLPIYATKDRIQMQDIWNHIKPSLCKSHLCTFPNSNNKSMCAAWRPNVVLKKVLWLHLQFFVNENEENTVAFNFSFLIGYIGIKYETRRRIAGSKICTMYLNFKEQNQKKIMPSTIFLPFTCLKWSDFYHCSPEVAFLFLLMALSLTKGQRQTGFKRKIADISGIKQVKNFENL